MFHTDDELAEYNRNLNYQNDNFFEINNEHSMNKLRITSIQEKINFFQYNAFGDKNNENLPSISNKAVGGHRKRAFTDTSNGNSTIVGKMKALQQMSKTKI